MKVVVVRESLLPVLKQTVKATASEKSLIDACKDFHLVAQSGSLTVTANNMTYQISQTISAAVEEEGAILVPAKAFLDLVSVYEDAKFEFTVSPKFWISYKCGKNSGRLKGLNPDEFPIMLEGGANSIKVSAVDMRHLIGQTVFAAARTDEKSQTLMGVLMTSDVDAGVTFVAADGVRLALREAEGSAENNVVGILPTESLKAILSLVPSKVDESHDVQVFMSEDKAKFQINGVTLITRIISGKYPEYERIIPKSKKFSIKFDRDDLIAALRTTRVFAATSARFTVDIPNGKVVVYGRDDETGDISTEVDAEIDGDVSKQEFNAHYNIKFLLEALSSLDSSHVALEVTGEKNPLVVRPIGDEQYIYVVMPLA